MNTKRRLFLLFSAGGKESVDSLSIINPKSGLSEQYLLIRKEVGQNDEPPYNQEAFYSIGRASAYSEQNCWDFPEEGSIYYYFIRSSDAQAFCDLFNYAQHEQTDCIYEYKNFAYLEGWTHGSEAHAAHVRFPRVKKVHAWIQAEPLTSISC